MPEKDTHEKEGQGILIGPGDGRTLKNPLGGPLTFKANADGTGGAVTVFESTPAPGEGPPLHRHEEQDEVLYVLEGQFRVRLEDVVRKAPAGSFVFLPRGLPHSWQNVGDREGRLLVLFTPGAAGMEGFLERFAEVSPDGPVADAFKEYAGDSGMEVLGPPLAQSHPLS
jgi:quercetin dioxygenase-like cupin family protein